MTRRRPPNRRASENFDFELNGLRFTATVSRRDDGQIQELFLNNYKSGNQSDTNARDSAIVASIALQCGADLATIRGALCRNSNGKALGPLATALDLLDEPVAVKDDAVQRLEPENITALEYNSLVRLCWGLWLNLLCLRLGLAEPYPKLPLAMFDGEQS